MPFIIYNTSMSIHDFVNKIKGLKSVSREDLYTILILIIVAFGAFYLGKISNIKLDNNNVDIVNTKIGEGIEYIK